MAWKKLGRIYCLPECPERSTTHMQGPVAIALGTKIRIYFSARDVNGRSYPTYMDVDIDCPTRVLCIHDKPIMEFGTTGTFDDEGIMPACVIKSENALWLYYSGWNRRVTIPYHNTTGVAYSNDGGYTYRKMFEGPILDRTPVEPYMAVTPWVMRLGDVWRMWYVSGLGWPEVNGVREPVYGIKSAVSNDGLHWERDGRLLIPMRHSKEAIARPTVVQRDDCWHMWYAFRDSVDFRDGIGSYQIGYAYSRDGEHWVRDDSKAGIDRSDEGWDTTMSSYPYILDLGDKLLLFYNGNGFGQTGIGCAVWEGALLS